MSDERKTPLQPQGTRGKKPRAPIIDLTATEIHSNTGESAASKSYPNIDDGPSAKEQMASDSMTAEKAVQAHKLNGLKIAVFATAILGIVVGFVFAVMLWSQSVPPAAINTSDVNAQIAELQRQITNLNNQFKAGRAINSDDLAQRLNATEHEIRSLRAVLDALNGHSGNLARQMARVSEQADATEKAVAQLQGSGGRSAPSAAATVDSDLIKSLDQRMAAFEQSLKNANAEIIKIAAAEKSVRLALSATMLNAAVTSGVPYRDEVQRTKSLYPDEMLFAPLEAFAATGIPSEAALAQQLRDSIPAIKAALRSEASNSGFVERLQDNVTSLIRITPIDAPPSDNPSDILARLENAATRADIKAALSELMKLPEPARAPAQAWIKKVEARQRALTAAQSLAAESARRLAPEFGPERAQ